MTQVYKVKVTDDGTIKFLQQGKLHRLDGPAIEYLDGHKEWWLNGKLHRLDGPAIEFIDGHTAYVIEGTHFNKASFIKATQPVKELSIQQLEDILGYKIKVIK